MPHQNVEPSTTQTQRIKPSFRKSALAVAIGLTMMTSGVYAETTNPSRYQIPSGPLSTSLSSFAADSGIALSFDPKLTNGLTSAPVSGVMSADKALEQMLSGSNLSLVKRADGSYTLEQKQPKAVTPQTSSPPPNETMSLAVVTVTGEKIQRDLQNTLTSVAVSNSDDIQRHGDQDLQNIMERTPGVYTQPGNENWGIRGVPVSGFDAQGAGTMNGAITVFVDGAPQTHRLMTLNPLRLWDVEQVEIFRGSQSTTLGRNSLAGAVVIQTKDPSFDSEFAAQANIGNYGEQGGAFMANGALVEDVVAGRIAFDYQEKDGYITNETLDLDANSSRAVNARGKLLIQPTDKLDLLLTLNRTEHRSGSEGVNAINGKPLYYRQYLNTEEFDELDQNTAIAKLDYYLNDTWTLTSISSGTWSKYHSVLDFDSGLAFEREAVRKHEQRLLSQELRLSYDHERLSGFFGAYYATHTNEINDRINLNMNGVDDPALTALGDVAIRNMALFGELNWEFVDDWTLITGLRYDHEENKSRFNYTDPLGLSVTDSASVDTSFNELLPKLGISHQLNDNHLIGLTWQKGYRGGGVDLSTSTEHLPYDPEFTSTYELAWRGSWLNEKLITNANIYHTDWKDQQVEIGDENGIAFVANAAKARMQGIEFSANYEFNRRMSAFVATSYNHTEYLDFTQDGQDLSGKQFPFAPEFKLAVGGSYTFINGLRVGTDIIHQSDSVTFSYGDTITERKNDRVTLVNFTADYPVSNNISLMGYVRNLFDREYITNNQTDFSLDVGAPRTFGIAIRAEM